MTQCWRLDDARQTLVLASQNARCPQIIYWGAALPQDEDLEALFASTQLDITGGMLDETPEMSICPQAVQSFPGQPGLVVSSANGTPLHPNLKFRDAKQGAQSLEIVCNDKSIGLTYTARFEIFPDTHIIKAFAEVDSVTPIHLHWFAAPVFPAPQLSSKMIDFGGRWCGEFQPNEIKWSSGIRLRENRTGRTGHEHFPALLVPFEGATNTSGEVIALHYGWSGGHRMVAEELPDGRRQIQFGHATQTMETPAKRFETAPLYAVYSPCGLNGIAVSFQRHVRDRIVPWTQNNQPRPVHYNCWEAVYFDHDLETLKEIATRAAGLGAERFVLDDGWFGKRDDDTSSLSDWIVDPRKYPQGLGPLIDHVRSLGLSFGIWFEPEMVNPDSDTYRQNPHWALGPEGQTLGRHQMVLDMTLPDVCDYVFERISTLLEAHPIDYIKWDHNRVLPMPDAAQTYGTYALLDKLRQQFPEVEIESCASGGGRIDFGILSRTQRIWLSDSNDALERLRMQHEAALFLPSAITGSHVGPEICHTSGRTLNISFRAWVAAQRHMGFEMDPRELSPDDALILKRVTQWWKDNRVWLFNADILRLDSADPAILAEQQLAREGDRFVVFAGKAGTSHQILPRPIILTDLEPNALYSVRLLNTEVIPRLSRGPSALKRGPITLSGTALMNSGLNLPWSFPETVMVLEGRKL